ncbi:MAG: hypothetical protein IJ656_03255 [Bacilli bacterium]|nr:hypothetical protein [Bacilli bacterium]MBR1582030.1 hypothetical protein [Bacilli bacterium]
MTVNKKLFYFLFVCSSLLLTGCKGKTVEPDNKEEEVNSYDLIYNGGSKEKHPIVKKYTDFNRASYGYMFNEVQGYNNWNYIEKNDGFEPTQMFFIDGKWQINGGEFDKGIFKTVESQKLGYLYQIPQAGNYSFNGTLKNIELKDSSLKIYKNDELIYELSVNKYDVDGRYFELTHAFNLNDKLYFLVNGESTYLNPCIVKGEIEALRDSLYNSHTDWNYYGDIHCYYYKDELYLFHLWNHSGLWQWYCQKGHDMFHYEECDYDTSFVKNHYMAWGNSADVVDYNQYSSARDCTTFFDEEVNRYRSIGLGYRKDGAPGQTSCDLFLRTSSDSLGFDWSEPAIALRKFPLTSDGEPECSQLIKIGKRWYLCAGVSGQSIHGVGTCSYWVSEENQTIDEVNWQALPTNKLDGEDLCVPQIEKVRDKYYLFGWMPSHYNGNNWGGYKNLPREVYVREDGTLGTKFDERCTKLLNKGSYFKLNEINVVLEKNLVNLTPNSLIFNGNDKITLQKQIEASYIEFDVNFQSGNEIRYSMNDGYDNYDLVLRRTNEGAYMEVVNGHGFVSSSYNLKCNNNNFHVKLTVEGKIVEFSVNDLIVLSGRTYMTEKYTPSFIADGNLELTNIKINRLTQLYDVYD